MHRVKRLLGGATVGLLLSVGAVGELASPAPARSMSTHHGTAVYYLALGDSLARGAQPFGPVLATGYRQTVPTQQGYSNDLYSSMLRGRSRTAAPLALKELGCLGETTTTMRKGGICSYPQGDQLDAAVSFIKHHKIALITLDIGANDVDGCGRDTGTALFACVGLGVQTIKANVPPIVKALRAAAGPKTLIIGMTYYDPFLADYLQGPSGQQLASESVGLAKSVNDTLTSDFKAQHMRVADVGTAFGTYIPFSRTTTLAGHGNVPVAVADICRWTWMCSPKPAGPNIHADRSGYSLIAQVFAKLL